MYTDLLVKCKSGKVSDLQTHTMHEKSRCTGDEKKTQNKPLFGLCFSFFSPPTLRLFSQICQCNLGLLVIFYPYSLTDREVLVF